MQVLALVLDSSLTMLQRSASGVPYIETAKCFAEALLTQSSANEAALFSGVCRS